MNINQARTYVIQPTLQAMSCYSRSAEELLVLTMAQESRGGYYLHQLGGGPAMGIYQMEPASYQDLEDWLKDNRPDLWKKIQELVIPMPTGSEGSAVAKIYRKFYLMLFDPCVPELMITDLKFATAMARAFYLRVPEPLPAADDVEGLAKYWKDHWNTYLGAGTVDEAIENYNRYA